MTLFLVLLNLVATLGAPAVVFHYTQSPEWAIGVASVPWLVNGWCLGALLGEKGRTGRGKPATTARGTVSFLWQYVLTPAAVGWAGIGTLTALIVAS